MPSTSDEPVDQPTVETPPAAETPTAPAVLTLDEFERRTRESQAQFAAQLEEQRRMFQSVLDAQRRPTAAPPAATDDPATWSEDQLQAAVDEGRLSVAKMTRIITERVTAAAVNPLRAAGADALSASTRTIATLRQTADGKPLYPHARRFEKEINEILAQVAAGGTIVNDTLYDQAYRYVVGGHVNELAEEVREATVRRANAPPPEPGTRGGRTSRETAAGGANDLPTPEEAFGATYMRALSEKGDIHAFMKRIDPRGTIYPGGYKDYVKLMRDQEAEAV